MRARPRDYLFPGWSASDGIPAALSAYAGGRNQVKKLGYREGVSWSYDINSAYPDITRHLPCLSHGRWRRTLTFDPNSFGLWRIRYRSSSHPRLYPFFFRTDNGSIIYPSNFDDRWVYTPELAAGLSVDGLGISIREGRVWDYDLCENPNPWWWVGQKGNERLAYKRNGEYGPSTGLKLPLNSLYGSMAQARGSAGFSQAPWTQQILWAGYITAYTRAKLYLAAIYSDDPYHLATDGLICGSRVPLDVGDELGKWEEETRTDLSLVQYGVYFSKEKNRWRGFDLSEDDVPEFVSRVHTAWCSKWRSLAVSQRLFITSGLIATGLRSFDKWCTWEDAQRTLNLDIDTPYEQGAVTSLDHLYDVQDMTRYYGIKLGTSKLYEPKWSVGGGFPYEDRDAVEEAFEAAYV